MIRDDGGCSDNLTANDISPNAGAESTICYLLATLDLAKIRGRDKTDRELIAEPKLTRLFMP